MQALERKSPGLIERALVGGIVFLVLVVAGVEMAQSAEILPSVGIARSTEGGDSKLYTGLAMRTGLFPMVQSELGVAYRKEDFGGSVSATTWPMTASLWFAPIPFAYAGGGLGWYHTSFSMEGAPAGAALAATQTNFGTHLGGGLRMPLAPMIGLDLNARYVILESKDDAALPSNYDPKFWSVALGLGIKLL